MSSATRNAPMDNSFWLIRSVSASARPCAQESEATLPACAEVCLPLAVFAAGPPGVKLKVAEVTLGGVLRKSGLYLCRASLRSVAGTLELARVVPWAGL